MEDQKVKTHWLKNPNKNYLGHWDFPNGKDMTLTIVSAKWEPVKNPVTGKSESCRVIRFKEKKIKPMICNQTNATSIVQSTSVKFMEDSPGNKITLYVATIIDNKTKENIDCIRVRPKKRVLPELLPNTPEWGKTLQAFANGFTIQHVKKRFTISDENLEQLIIEAT